MLPLPPRHELRRRLPQLLVGLVLYGLGDALMVASDLGLGPWDVLHQGISFHTPIPIGTVGIFTGLIVLLLWIPLRERFGLGTALNVILIGVVIDVTLIWLDTPDPIALRWVYVCGGVLMVGIATGTYIGAGLGPGPRDGLMTGLARRGFPIGLVRTGIELVVLSVGWLLGGTVGIGTILFAVGIGPIVQIALPRLAVGSRKRRPTPPAPQPEGGIA